MRFTPTSSSWTNLVERFFSALTEDRARAGSFASVTELTDAITAYLTGRNENPKPYQCKASGKEILDKIQRTRKALAINPSYLRLRSLDLREFGDSHGHRQFQNQIIWKYYYIIS